MRDVAFWLSGAALAFLLTAGAFLLLANLATAPSEKTCSRTRHEAGVRTSRGTGTGQRTARISQAAPGSESRPCGRERGDRQLSDVNMT